MDSIWVTPKRKNIDGHANRTKKAKIAQKEPHPNISKQLAIQKPWTKIPDSEIQIESIVQDSPSFVPYNVEILRTKGKEKGVKEVKMNIMGSDLGMARTKKTLQFNRESHRWGGQRKLQKLPCPNLVRHHQGERPLENS